MIANWVKSTTTAGSAFTPPNYNDASLVNAPSQYDGVTNSGGVGDSSHLPWVIWDLGSTLTLTAINAFSSIPSGTSAYFAFSSTNGTTWSPISGSNGNSGSQGSVGVSCRYVAFQPFNNSAIGPSNGTLFETLVYVGGTAVGNLVAGPGGTVSPRSQAIVTKPFYEEQEELGTSSILHFYRFANPAAIGAIILQASSAGTTGDNAQYRKRSINDANGNPFFTLGAATSGIGPALVYSPAVNAWLLHPAVNYATGLPSGAAPDYTSPTTAAINFPLSGWLVTGGAANAPTFTTVVPIYPILSPNIGRPFFEEPEEFGTGRFVPLSPTPRPRIVRPKRLLAIPFYEEPEEFGTASIYRINKGGIYTTQTDGSAIACSINNVRYTGAGVVGKIINGVLYVNIPGGVIGTTPLVKRRISLIMRAGTAVDTSVDLGNIVSLPNGTGGISTVWKVVNALLDVETPNASATTAQLYYSLGTNAAFSGNVATASPLSVSGATIYQASTATFVAGALQLPSGAKLGRAFTALGGSNTSLFVELEEV